MENILANLAIFSDPFLSPKITFIVCGLIIFFSMLGIYGRISSSNKNLIVYPWTSITPSVVISLGIFGTFLGIFLGLINFDTTDINKSIP